jgi:Tfp pilus assembly protein PilW
MVRREQHGEGGFTLVELMIAAALTMVVVGAAVGLATRVQSSYQYEIDDAAVQQEARFALDWITRTIAAGGSNPYDIGSTDNPAADSCSGVEPGFVLSVDGNSIRVLADVTKPNGLLAGEDGASPCTEEGEDVLIAYDDMTDTITRDDAALDAGTPSPMTDTVVSDLSFTFLNSARAVTTNPASLAYVQVSVTVRSKTLNPYTNQNTTYTYTSEVRVRS